MIQPQTFEEYLKEHRTGGGAVYHQIRVTWLLDAPVFHIRPLCASGSADFIVHGNVLKPVVNGVVVGPKV